MKLRFGESRKCPTCGRVDTLKVIRKRFSSMDHTGRLELVETVSTFKRCLACGGEVREIKQVDYTDILYT